MQVYSNANEQRNNKYLASWFTRTGEKTLIETINIGSVNSKYLSSIIYSYEGEKKHCLLENQYLNNAADKFNKIFVESYSENDQKNGITIIDKDSGKIEKRVNFKNAFTSFGRQMIDHNNNLVTYGNNDLNNFPQKEAQSAIGVLNCKTYETTEYLFENEKIIFSYIHNNNIYVITDSNRMYIFNDKLKPLAKKDIAYKTFFEYFTNNDYTIRKILNNNKVISVLYTSKKFDPENLGFIVEYNSEDISVLNKFDITLKAEKKWLGEVVDFIKLD